jgi:hypothetical protein
METDVGDKLTLERAVPEILKVLRSNLYTRWSYISLFLQVIPWRREGKAMVTLSPRLGGFLTKATQTPDLETALWKVLLEYVELKREALQEQVAQFEGKWGMSFGEFSRRCQEGSLQADPIHGKLNKISGPGSKP